MSVKERWRNHKKNAADNRYSAHPFYRLVNEIGPDSFEIETVAVFDDRYKAMTMEEQLISMTPKELSLNLSIGGLNDASEGGRIFWERLNADPEKKAEFLRKLSEAKKADDWTDYENLMKASAKWRHDHPRDAYKIAYRASRIARRKKGLQSTCENTNDDRPLKEKLMRRHKPNEVAKRNATKIWHQRSADERREIGKKIAAKQRKNMEGKSIEERREITLKARASIDRSIQGPAACRGLRNWWERLKEDPERYKAVCMERSARMKARWAKRREKKCAPTT